MSKLVFRELDVVWRRFISLRKTLKENGVETKKDLSYQPKHVRDEYIIFTELLKVDKRKKPGNVLLEFERYKKTGLAFKSHALGFDLSKIKDLRNQKYKSGSGMAAKVTDALAREGDRLEAFDVTRKKIDIAYNRTRLRKVISFQRLQVGDFKFMLRLPDNFFVNIGDTAYNKSAFEFVHDVRNMSASFEENLVPLFEDSDESLSIYKW